MELSEERGMRRVQRHSWVSCHQRRLFEMMQNLGLLPQGVFAEVPCGEKASQLA